MQIDILVYVHELKVFLPFPDALPEFNLADKNRTTTQGVQYDYLSIMHFTNMQFSSNGNSTLELKAIKQIPLGGDKCPTSLDYFHIILLYCDGKKILFHYNDIDMIRLFTQSYLFTK